MTNKFVPFQSLSVVISRWSFTDDRMVAYGRHRDWPLMNFGMDMSQQTEVTDTESSKGYFKDDEMHRLLHETESRYKSAINTDGMDASDINFFIIRSLAAMRNNYIAFERDCLFNIEMIGRVFKEKLETIDPQNSKDSELLAAYIFRFVQEYEVSNPNDISDELRYGLRVMPDLNLDHRAASEIKYGQHSMLIGVLKKYLHHEDIVAIKKLPGTIERAVRINADSERTLNEGQQKVAHLAEGLKKLKIGSDFVELASGFSKMRTRKAIEKHFNFACLLLLAAMMISPAALKIYVYYAELKIPEIDVYTAVSIAALELVFVYFFRVALHNFRGVKAQILQLDLRIALLQFIQSYVKFSGDARKIVSKSNGEISSKELTLDRFEQVIFSGLVAGENELPSTFDGLDGLAKIIEKVKGK
ncbi:hypothetical protein HX797_04615 [Pseudomonas edaphica]|uniref:Uncharacterized protein n=1 Tax=Pseudomonas edaphica TaxID=2006980 RepID=A0A7Y7RNI1_9PSED|nr:hypothetical protein [Pseudomonas edaphica]NVZ55537.1 hypothetical protein [Pseudomonas edaphica]